MSRPSHPGAGGSSTWYRIRIDGHLDPRWTDWFGEMTLDAQEDGTTVLHGPVTDQSALHGLLQTVRDLGLPLLSVTPDVPPDKEPPA